MLTGLVQPPPYALAEVDDDSFRGGQLAFFRRWRVALDNAGHSEWSGIVHTWKHEDFISRKPVEEVLRDGNTRVQKCPKPHKP